MNSLWDLAIRATFVVGAGLLGHRILRNTSAEIRSNVLRLTAASLALLPIGFLWGPELPVVMPWMAKPAPITVDASVLSAAVSDLPVAAPAATPWMWPMIAWGAVATLVGARAWLAFRPLRRDWKTSRSINLKLQIEVLEALMQLKVKRHVDVRLSDVSTPLTYGVVRPRIVLPLDFEEWPREHRRSVLLHEAAHIKRFDCGWQWLTTALRAVYWCHPLVWPMSWSLRDEAELAADERVIRTGVEATDYASSLVEIARNLNLNRGIVRSQGVTFMNDHQLDRRVQGALAHRRRGFGFLGSLGLMAAALATTFFAAGLRLQEPQQEITIIGQGANTTAQATVPAQRMEQGQVLVVEGNPLFEENSVLLQATAPSAKSKSKQARLSKSRSKSKTISAKVMRTMPPLVTYSVEKALPAMITTTANGLSFQMAKSLNPTQARNYSLQALQAAKPFMGLTRVYANGLRTHAQFKALEGQSLVTYTNLVNANISKALSETSKIDAKNLELTINSALQQAGSQGSADDAKRKAELDAVAANRLKAREEAKAAQTQVQQAEVELRLAERQRELADVQIVTADKLRDEATQKYIIAHRTGPQSIELARRAKLMQNFVWDPSKKGYTLITGSGSQIVLIDAKGRRQVVHVASGKTLTLKVGKDGKAVVVNPKTKQK